MAGTNKPGNKDFVTVFSKDPISAIRFLYSLGLSSRQISELISVSKSRIQDCCVDIARNKSEANQLRFPSKSKHWRSSRRAARKKMERFLGRELATNEHVHHIDGDFTNNSFENLIVLSAREHAKLHAEERWAQKYEG